MGGVIGLDMGAVMLVAQARDVDTAMLADVLPSIEAVLLKSFDGDDASDG